MSNIHIDIKGQSEESLQQKIVFWFHNNYPQYRGALFHVPNGDARTKIAGARLKRLGVIAGVSDLILLTAWKPIFIELKAEGKNQSPRQKKWQKLVEGLGYDYIVMRSLQEFKDFIKKIGI